ncbi:unnamed protein product [marine sediment metagenome]|uniref:Uncharacterized protein n=1 Tax=marine sediment metagenome TaxID=412755 RepID=X1F145_9ZZZZ
MKEQFRNWTPKGKIRIKYWIDKEKGLPLLSHRDNSLPLTYRLTDLEGIEPPSKD